MLRHRCTPYIIKNENTLQLWDRIFYLSNLVFASCVWYSDRALHHRLDYIIWSILREAHRLGESLLPPSPNTSARAEKTTRKVHSSSCEIEYLSNLVFASCVWCSDRALHHRLDYNIWSILLEAHRLGESLLPPSPNTSARAEKTTRRCATYRIANPTDAWYDRWRYTTCFGGSSVWELKTSPKRFFGAE